MKDLVKLVGHFKLTNVKTGKVLVDDPNTVMTVGKAWVAARMLGGSSLPMAYMQVGTNGTLDNSDQTTLVAFLDENENDAPQNGLVAANKITFVNTLGAGTGTGALVESGIFDNTQVSGTAIMLARKVFDVVNKGADDIYVITWEFTIS